MYWKSTGISQMYCWISTGISQMYWKSTGISQMYWKSTRISQLYRNFHLTMQIIGFTKEKNLIDWRDWAYHHILYILLFGWFKLMRAFNLQHPTYNEYWDAVIRFRWACQTGPGNLVWSAHIIQRFCKKHQLIDVIFFYGHRSTWNLPVSHRPSTSLAIIIWSNVYGQDNDIVWCTVI